MSNDADISDLPVPDNDISDLPAPNKQASWWDAVKGVGDAGLAVGSGALKGINAAANDILPGEQGRAAMRQQIERDPVMNYKPHTEGGQLLMNWLGKATKPIGQMMHGIHQGISDLTSPRTADVVGDLATLAPGARGAFSKIGDASAIEEGHPLTAAAQEERASLGSIKSGAESRGYDLPEQGTQARHAEAAATNQPLVNADVRAELGLPKNADLTPGMLAKARAANASPAYQAVEKLPDRIPLSREYEATMRDVGDLLPPRIRAKIPEGGEITGQQAVGLTKVLRNRAAQLDKATGITASGDIPSDLAQAHRDLAEGIEDSVRDHLAQSGREKLADAWNDARVYTAKSYSVEHALDGAGNVKASDLKSQLFAKGKPLSGKLSDIANLAAQYPEAFRTTRVTQPTPGLIRKGAAALAPIAGGTVGGFVGGPVGAGMGTAAGEYGSQKLLQNK